VPFSLLGWTDGRIEENLNSIHKVIIIERVNLGANSRRRQTPLGMSSTDSLNIIAGGVGCASVNLTISGSNIRRRAFIEDWKSLPPRQLERCGACQRLSSLFVPENWGKLLSLTMIEQYSSDPGSSFNTAIVCLAEHYRRSQRNETLLGPFRTILEDED
jgi:hypothetical protein